MFFKKKAKKEEPIRVRTLKINDDSITIRDGYEPNHITETTIRTSSIERIENFHSRVISIYLNNKKVYELSMPNANEIFEKLSELIR